MSTPSHSNSKSKSHSPEVTDTQTLYMRSSDLMEAEDVRESAEQGRERVYRLISAAICSTATATTTTATTIISMTIATATTTTITTAIPIRVRVRVSVRRDIGA